MRECLLYLLLNSQWCSSISSSTAILLNKSNFVKLEHNVRQLAVVGSSSKSASKNALDLLCHENSALSIVTSNAEGNQVN